MFCLHYKTVLHIWKTVSLYKVMHSLHTMNYYNTNVDAVNKAKTVWEEASAVKILM